MTESIYQFVLNKLNASRGEWQTIAEGSGVALTTVRKIGYQSVKNPGVKHIDKLNKYFRERSKA